MVNISRRNVLISTAFAGMTGLSGTASAAAAPCSAAMPKKWNYEADVVIIGAGAVGLPAAIGARDAGLSVLVVDANYDIGGHAITSGGNVPLGGGTSFQKKYGIKDSPELVFKDLTDWSIVESGGMPDYRYNDRAVQHALAFNMAPAFEFLLANGDENLAKYLESVDTIEPIPDAFFNPLYEKLKMYYVTGGMPEPVLMWTEARDVSAMQEALSGIIGAYERDFAKHPNISEFPKISMIWKSIPSQLARENKKFIYKVVKEGARAREYEDALQWLVDARLVHKIYRSTAPGLPVAAYDDLSAFKIYLVDVGLLRRLAQLAPTAFGEGNRLFTEFKGALTENFVLQTLITQFEVVPRYWSQNNPPYEVDFLIQRENDIFPVEVKSEANTTSKTLKKFKELFPDQVKLRVRFSLDNLKLDDDVLNIPLFMADQADRLIGLALEKKNSFGQ